MTRRSQRPNQVRLRPRQVSANRSFRLPVGTDLRPGPDGTWYPVARYRFLTVPNRATLSAAPGAHRANDPLDFVMFGGDSLPQAVLSGHRPAPLALLQRVLPEFGTRRSVLVAAGQLAWPP